MESKFLHTALVFFSLLFINSLSAQVYWDGQAGTTSWTDGLNWTTDQVPTSADDVILSGNFVDIPLGVAANAKSVSLADFSILIINPTGSLNISGSSDFALTLDESTIILDGNILIANVPKGVEMKNPNSLILITGYLGVNHYSTVGLQFASTCTNCQVDNAGIMSFDNGGTGSTAAINFQNASTAKVVNQGNVTIGLNTNGGGGIALGLVGATFENSGDLQLLKTGSGYPGINNGFIPGSLTNQGSGNITFGTGIGGTPIGGFNLNLTNNGMIDWDKAGSVDVVLMGSGTMAGVEPVVNMNSISPGNSPGCLTFASGLTHSGLTNIEIEGTIACTEYDKVVVSGAATISGNVNVSLINGFVPTAGQVFTLLEASSISGTYGTVSYPSVPGIIWETVYTATTVEAHANAVLPVGMVDFKARTIDQQIVLNWITESERNNSGFYVERSFDSRKWESIGFVQGKGDSFKSESYFFRDQKPSIGINYYRLRQVDFDGAKKFSEVVNATIESGKEIRIYPNPTTDVLVLEGEQEPNTSVRVLNSGGLVVLEQSFSGEAIQVGHLNPGVYVLEISGGASPVYKRFLVKR